MVRNLAVLCLLSGFSSAGPILYLTNSQNQLLTIDAATPGSVTTVGAITGLQGGESIFGIDFRPATGQLYGLGSTSRLYTINTATATATQVGSAGAFTLSGTSFGFDFNPTVDRIRVTSNAGQNLRLNPNDGTLTSTDTALNGATTTAMGSAYTNSFSGAVTTSLYALDANSDALYLSSNPNGGTYGLVGSLGINSLANVGFDIAFPGNVGWAALSVVPGTSQLYTIDLGTGAATLVGSIGSEQTITGLAVTPGAVPEPSTVLITLTGLGLIGASWRRRTTL